MKQVDPTSATAIKFIEFMGLPGSGKSTIAALLESDLRRLGVETVSGSADRAPFVQRHWSRLRRIIRNAGRCRRPYLIRPSAQRVQGGLWKHVSCSLRL